MRAALVARVLEAGLDAGLADSEVDPYDDGENALVDPADRMTCEFDLIAASGTFAEFGYVWHNPRLYWSLCGHREGLRHFVQRGWRELRNPTPDFDVWWYWLTYLDPAADDVNPLVHYLAEGRHLGHVTIPPVSPPRDPAVPLGPGARRICLFAGYDTDGVIDETVVAYVRELSRFADVYYLADCALEAGELDKLAPYTQARWAIRHGRYDFGSYSMLARDLVGWDTIATYDELLLVNDSCYLLRPLDELFDRMRGRPAHWWGLQATHESFTEGDLDRLGHPLPLDDLVTEAREVRPWRLSDIFHVGSYFLAFRSEVVGDAGFRHRLDTVASQSDKNDIIRKYEIGISSYLALRGYQVTTFVDGVLPFHPIYQESALRLIDEGFPFLKRQFLHENQFDVPDLDHWKERVLAASPGADVEAMEQNLWRVSPSYNLQRALDIHTRPNGTIALPEVAGPDNFEVLEHWAPRFSHWWAFAVDTVTHRLEGHARAVFEAVRQDPSIKKIVIGASGSARPGGQNVTNTGPVHTQEATYYLMRAGTIFVTDGPRADLAQPLSPEVHQFVVLGRATHPLAFGAALRIADGDDPAAHDERLHDLDLTSVVIASSRRRRRAMEPALRSGIPPKVWVTGSPRTDLMVGPEENLAADLRAQLDTLRRATRGRRLVVWAPAARSAGQPLPTLSRQTLRWLTRWCERQDAMVAVRPPTGGAPQGWLESDVEGLRAAGLSILSRRVVPDTEMVLREAAALVSDLSSDLVDYLVLDRPILAFVPDLEAISGDPGLVHDLHELVPRRVCRNEPELVDAWDRLLDAPTAEQEARHAEIRDQLHASRDGRNGTRVARKVQRTYLPISRWLAEPS